MTVSSGQFIAYLNCYAFRCVVGRRINDGVGDAACADYLIAVIVIIIIACWCGVATTSVGTRASVGRIGGSCACTTVGETPMSPNTRLLHHSTTHRSLHQALLID